MKIRHEKNWHNYHRKVGWKLVESYLLEENNQIFLSLVVLFLERHFRMPQLIKINRFAKSKKNWMTEKFFSLTLENFHGCKLTIGFWGFNYFRFPFLHFTSGVVDAGAIIEMTEALSTHLKFTFKTIHWKRQNSIYHLLPSRFYNHDHTSIRDPILTT